MYKEIAHNSYQDHTQWAKCGDENQTFVFSSPHPVNNILFPSKTLHKYMNKLVYY